MRWPKLVPAMACATPVTLRFTQGVDLGGVPKVVKEVEAMCSYREESRQVMDKERRLVAVSSVVLLDGDPAPELPELEGTVSVLGAERMIVKAARARNPDGTVNYTRLELM